MPSIALDDCDKLGILEREWHDLMEEAYSYGLDPLTNEYPLEAQRLFTRVRGNERMRRALLLRMDEQRMGLPDGSLAD